MLHCPDTLRACFPDLDSGCLVLTPNHLTSIQLRDWYGQWRVKTGLSPVYPSPAIFPVDIWIRQCCNRLLEAGSSLLPAVRLLEPAEEHLVWHQVISQSRVGTTLLNATATSRAVQDAWALEHLWRIARKDLEHLAPSYTASGHDDLSAYLAWSDDFRRYCRDRQLATQVELLEQLVTLIPEQPDALLLPPSLVLLGFSAPPPLYAILLEALTGVRDTTHLDLPRQTPSVTLHPAENPAAELQAAALWARQILQEDPDAKVGIIMVDVHQRYSEARRTFARVFAPEESRSLSPVAHMPFNLGGGQGLGRTPIIRAALLSLGRNRLTVDTLETCQWLRSPFLSGAVTEHWPRASLERCLRERNMPRVSNNDLKYLAALTERAYHCPALVTALADFDALPRPGLRKDRTTREWEILFRAQLGALGWPGPRPLSDEEKRALDSWEEVMAQFSRLTPVLGLLAVTEALAVLTRLADNHVLRALADSHPLRILSPLEADGLHFTHCRMLGMSEQQWPPPPRVSPFIPYSLQKAHGIPETDATRYAGQMTQMLADLIGRTASAFVFSHPVNRDEIPLKPALILQQFMPGGVSLPATARISYLHPLAAEQDSDDATELLEEAGLLPLTDLDRLKGGSQLLADQAECPFRSFVHHRLKARPLEKLVYGLDPRASGNLVHLALELLWKALASQPALLAMPEADLEALVARVVNAAVNDMRQKQFHTMTDSFCALEEIRLQELLLQWLQEERQRGSFTVLASELDTQWQCGDLTLNLRIDRIDGTDSGDLVLVDYKTGRSTRVDWEDERPANSQLMLYALATTQARARAALPELAEAKRIAGVYFAQVNIETTRYTGLSAEAGTYPGTSIEELRGKNHGLSATATWDDLRLAWEASLAMLAEEFLNGCVAITPKSRQCCDYCHARPVCRIDEANKL